MVKMKTADELYYSIFDPTGNITALVETRVDRFSRKSVADKIMALHPNVEQVGFVKMECDEAPVRLELEMTGGEFCGNASMCSAAWYLLHTEADSDGSMAGASGHAPVLVPLRVSGASHPVRVCLQRTAPDTFQASLQMPPAEKIQELMFSSGTRCGLLPVVFMEGISHIIVEPDSAFFTLKDNPAAAEKAVREWCRSLSADGLGLMFLDGYAPDYIMTPLVYIPGSETSFWENSCASGSCAVSFYLAHKKKAPVSLTLQEPGGCLLAACDPLRNETVLQGQVRLVENRSLPFSS